MMRRLGAYLLVAFGVALMIVQGVEASGGGDRFDSLANALSEQYSAKATKIPLMWAVSLCARAVTHNGVRGMRVVEFDRFGPVEDRAAFEEMVRSKLGEEWSEAVRVREANGEETLIYMNVKKELADMVVVNLDHRELNLVRMKMNPEQLARWMKERERPVAQ